jgi:hypothetical protein
LANVVLRNSATDAAIVASAIRRVTPPFIVSIRLLLIALRVV